MRKRLSKSEVRYRPALKGSDQRCGTCSMFHKGTCSLVAGDIRRNDVCERWEPK